MKDIKLINHPLTHELTVGDEPDRIDGNFRIYKFVSKYESITLKLEHVELIHLLRGSTG